MSARTPLSIGITCYPTYGGSGAVAVDLAEALSRRGHEVHVISYASPFRLELETNVRFHEVAVPSYPLFKYPPYAMALASQLAEVAVHQELDVLHAHYAIPHSIAAFLAREISGRQDLGVVTTLHGTDVTLVGTDPSYLPSTRFGIERSDRVTAVSEYLKQETLRSVGDRVPIDVIPNFVDVHRYAPRPPAPLRERYARPDEPLLLHMSNFRPVKRVADVVRIFHRVYRDHPVRMVMVGDGPDRPMAEAMLREIELHHRVSFTGALPDAAALLAQADAFLLPSDGESFGLAALESLSSGVPVVGARAGGLPEVVTDGETGILERVGHVEAMGERLSRLLADEDGLRTMRDRCRSDVEARFKTETVVPRYEALYRETIARRRQDAGDGPPRAEGAATAE